MAIWQLQDAKAKFSELVDTAQDKGPQFITRHGRLTAVVLSKQEYEHLNGNGNDALVAHLLGGPKVEKFRIERDRFVERKFECNLEDDLGDD